MYHYFRVSKKVRERDRGDSGFSEEIVLSHSAKHFLEQTFCAAFQKVSSNAKVLEKRGKEYQKFQSKVFCLTVPKNFVEEPFCAVFQKVSGSQNVYG